MDDIKKVICYDKSGNETLNIDVPEIPAALAIGSTHIDFDKGLAILPLTVDPISTTHNIESTSSSQNESLKWEQFKDHMYHLHEMQNEGCRGCERPTTECRECMQKYYWDNISYYLKYEIGG